MTGSWWTTFHQLGKKGDDETITYPGWGPERPWLSLPFAGRGEKDDSNVAPFLTTGLAAYIHLWLNVMRSKHFLSHLILTLSWCLKKRIRSRRGKFTPSYTPFGIVQIMILRKSWVDSAVSVERRAVIDWIVLFSGETDLALHRFLNSLCLVLFCVL